jgi:hypothetical protein
MQDCRLGHGRRPGRRWKNDLPPRWGCSQSKNYDQRTIPVPPRLHFFLYCSVIAISVAFGSGKTAERSWGDPPDIRGIRFDPSYHYNLNQPVPEYVDSLCRMWQASRINTVYFKAYDPNYGAVYKTSYRYNRMTDYGKKDFMDVFLRAAHRYGIRFIVWLPVLEHKGAWENRKDWRIKNRGDSDLMPFPNRHFLCARRPEVQEWWLGFIKDILLHYPDVDGVDFAEPAIVWKDRVTCACAICRRDLGARGFSPTAIHKRARTFADLLGRSCGSVHAMKKITCVTLIPTSDRKGNLLPLSEQKVMTGLDIDRLLDSSARPEWISCEVLWQQWADTYHDPRTFKSSWTQRAVEQARLLIADRARFIAHVELSSLGAVKVRFEDFDAAMTAAAKGGARSIEFYDAHLADTMRVWEGLSSLWPNRSGR